MSGTEKVNSFTALPTPIITMISSASLGKTGDVWLTWANWYFRAGFSNLSVAWQLVCSTWNRVNTLSYLKLEAGTLKHILSVLLFHMELWDRIYFFNVSVAFLLKCKLSLGLWEVQNLDATIVTQFWEFCCSGCPGTFLRSLSSFQAQPLLSINIFYAPDGNHLSILFSCVLIRLRIFFLRSWEFQLWSRCFVPHRMTGQVNRENGRTVECIWFSNMSLSLPCTSAFCCLPLGIKMGLVLEFMEFSSSFTNSQPTGLVFDFSNRSDLQVSSIFTLLQKHQSTGWWLYLNWIPGCMGCCFTWLHIRLFLWFSTS